MTDQLPIQPSKDQMKADIESLVKSKENPFLKWRDPVESICLALHELNAFISSSVWGKAALDGLGFVFNALATGIWAAGVAIGVAWSFLTSFWMGALTLGTISTAAAVLLSMIYVKRFLLGIVHCGGDLAWLCDWINLKFGGILLMLALAVIFGLFSLGYINIRNGVTMARDSYGSSGRKIALLDRLAHVLSEEYLYGVFDKAMNRLYWLCRNWLVKIVFGVFIVGFSFSAIILAIPDGAECQGSFLWLCEWTELRRFIGAFVGLLFIFVCGLLLIRQGNDERQVSDDPPE